MRRSLFPSIPVVTCGLIASGAVALIGNAPRAASQGVHQHFIPDAQVPNRAAPTATAQRSHPALSGLVREGLPPSGMEGWGSSTYDVYSASNGALNFRSELTSGDGLVVSAEADLALPWARVDLGGNLDAAPGFYHGIVTSGEGAGVIVRTYWSAAGGATAYEAPAPSLDLVFPILVRAVGDLGTELWTMNTVPQGVLPVENLLEYSVHSNETGEEILEFFQRLEPGESGHEDTTFNPRFASLPDRPGGGYIGALWLHGEEPIAAIEYLEDYAGAASAAVRALPVSSGATRQILPWARAGEDGGSLVGIASVADAPGRVVITYVDAVTGRELARQTTSLAPRGATYVDLGDRGLGMLAPPVQVRSNFDGSVLIESDVPVLAAVYDLGGEPGSATGAAYNAFGPQDLADSVAVAGIGAAGRPSELMIQNGAARDLDVRVTFRGPAGDIVGSADSTVLRGARWTVVASAAGNVEVVSALVEATGDIAVLTRDWNIGAGPDCALSAGIAVAPEVVPTAPSITATEPRSSDTPTPLTRTPATNTATPTGTDLGEYRTYLPRALASRSTD